MNLPGLLESIQKLLNVAKTKIHDDNIRKIQQKITNYPSEIAPKIAEAINQALYLLYSPQPRIPITEPDVQTKIKIYDITKESKLISVYGIDGVEPVKDHILDVKSQKELLKVQPKDIQSVPNNVMTWFRTLLKEGSVTLKGILNSVLKYPFPAIDKQFLEKTKVIHPENQSEYNNIINEKTRNSTTRAQTLGLYTSIIAAKDIQRTHVPLQHHLETIDISESITQFFRDVVTLEEMIAVTYKHGIRLLQDYTAKFDRMDGGNIDVLYWKWSSLHHMKSILTREFTHHFGNKEYVLKKDDIKSFVELPGFKQAFQINILRNIEDISVRIHRRK